MPAWWWSWANRKVLPINALLFGRSPLATSVLGFAALPLQGFRVL
jgi:hypothetical protein